MANELNRDAESHAQSLIDKGSVNKSDPWSFSADDENNLLGDPPDWTRYAMWHLGTDTAAAEETKGRYAYPYGKDDVVYRSGLVAVKERAAQQGDDGIAEAAGKLLDDIDEDKQDQGKDESTEKESTTGRISYPHLASRLFGKPLAVSRAKLEVVLNYLGPRLAGVAPISISASDFLVAAPSYEEAEILDGGICVVPIAGTLVHRAMGAPEPMSGLTSYQKIRSDFDAALEDPVVRAIVLDIDSGGGEVNGLFDFVDHIYASRGKKPIYALVDDCAYSAAYTIASAADRVFITRTGGVGSIGVMCVHVDETKANEQAGLKYTLVYAGAHKTDLDPDKPLSKDAQAGLQAEVDRIYGILVATVARNRGISADVVTKTEAALFFGENAIAAKLADELGSVDEALASIRTRLAAPARPAYAANVVDFEKAKAEIQDSAKTEARRHEAGRAKEVMQAARAAGLPSFGAELIEQGVDLEQARVKLNAKLVELGGPEIVTRVDPVARSNERTQVASPSEIYARRREQAQRPATNGGNR